MRRPAFTLVELLVVISIIAILLMIMAPTSRMLLMRTEMDICQSNLHHLGMANAQYLANNHNRFMPHNDWIRGSDYKNLNDIINGMIFPYVNNANYFLCPTFKSVCDPAAKRSYVMQHSFNDPGWYSPPWGNGYTLLTMADVKDPSRLMLLSEEATYIIPGYSKFTVNDARLRCTDWPNRDSISQFHYPGPGDLDKQVEGVANVVFVDGHVGAYKTMQTPYLVNQNWYEDPVKAADAGF